MRESSVTRRATFQDPLKLFPRLLRRCYTEWLRLTYPFASMGPNVSIHYTCPIDRKNAHRIQLGANISLEKDASLSINRNPEEGEPVIIIDDNCVIHWRSQIGAKNLIHIERDVLIAQDALIVDNNHAYEDVSRPIASQGFTEGGKIRIGRGTFIAHGASIICSRGEIVLGANCFVAAYAVVTRSAPPYSVLYGDPARVIRQFDPARGEWILGPVRAAQSEPAG